jgi:hypothetical protein
MRSSTPLVCLVAGLTLTAASAQAQLPSVPARMPCHDYHKIAETLGKRYGEQPVSLGMQTNGHVLQVFTSPESGSWTILSVAPSGIGCIVAAGRGWQSRPATGRDRGV